MKDVVKKYEEVMAMYSKEMLNFPWQDPEFYANWCAQTYYYVNHSSRLIMLAGSYFSFNYPKLHRRFMDYCKEEGGHEKLALNDLKGLSRSIENYPEFYSTSCFYQSQYYWIQHHGGPSFFGYILALEGLAVTMGAKILEKVKEAHGPKAVAFWKVHAAEDIEHIKEAFEAVEQLSPEDQKMVIKNLEQSSLVYLRMLSDCAEKAGINKFSKAG